MGKFVSCYTVPKNYLTPFFGATMIFLEESQKIQDQMHSTEADFDRS
jgi:hypothetical protein